MTEHVLLGLGVEHGDQHEAVQDDADDTLDDTDDDGAALQVSNAANDGEDTADDTDEEGNDQQDPEDLVDGGLPSVGHLLVNEEDDTGNDQADDDSNDVRPAEELLGVGVGADDAEESDYNGRGGDSEDVVGNDRPLVVDLTGADPLAEAEVDGTDDDRAESCHEDLDEAVVVLFVRVVDVLHEEETHEGHNGENDFESTHNPECSSRRFRIIEERHRDYLGSMSCIHIYIDYAKSIPVKKGCWHFFMHRTLINAGILHPEFAANLKRFQTG